MENTYHHTQLPEGRIPALRVEPMPADTNQSGEVFGGWVMSQVDLAGANTAMRYALSRYIVTRAVSSLTFEAPVLVGDVVSFYTEIIKVGRTSVTVKVEVYAERLTKLCNNIAKITEAELVYVALGADKKPITLEESAPSSRSAAPLKRGQRFPVPEQRRPRSRASGRFFPSAGDALVFIHQGEDEGAGRGNGADGDEGGVEGGFHGLSGSG